MTPRIAGRDVLDDLAGAVGAAAVATTMRAVEPLGRRPQLLEQRTDMPRPRSGTESRSGSAAGAACLRFGPAVAHHAASLQQQCARWRMPARPAADRPVPGNRRGRRPRCLGGPAPRSSSAGSARRRMSAEQRLPAPRPRPSSSSMPTMRGRRGNARFRSAHGDRHGAEAAPFIEPVGQQPFGIRPSSKKSIAQTKCTSP